MWWEATCGREKSLNKNQLKNKIIKETKRRDSQQKTAKAKPTESNRTRTMACSAIIRRHLNACGAVLYSRHDVGKSSLV